MSILLAFLIGLAFGYYADRTLYYLKDLRDRVKEAKEYKAAGVVKPGVTPVTKGTSEPIDLSSETGGVRRPSPEKAMLTQMKEREERLRHL